MDPELIPAVRRPPWCARGADGDGRRDGRGTTGQLTGNGLGGDGRVGDRDGADGGGDEEQRCAGRSIRAAETRSTQRLWCSTQLPTTRRRRAMPKYPPNGVPMSVFGALGFGALGPGPGAVS